MAKQPYIGVLITKPPVETRVWPENSHSRNMRRTCPAQLLFFQSTGTWNLVYTTTAGASGGKIGPFVGEVQQEVDIADGLYVNYVRVGPLTGELEATWEVVNKTQWKVTQQFCVLADYIGAIFGADDGSNIIYQRVRSLAPITLVLPASSHVEVNLIHALSGDFQDDRLHAFWATAGEERARASRAVDAVVPRQRHACLDRSLVGERHRQSLRACTGVNVFLHFLAEYSSFLFRLGVVELRLEIEAGKRVLLSALFLHIGYLRST